MPDAPDTTLPGYLTSDGWSPSTWQPGMPATPQHIDLQHLPMPTQEQIEAQRKAINQRLSNYGYQSRKLSDEEVLSTMAPLPQAAVQWPDWVQDYFARHPEEHVGARLGIDRPTNQTYEDWNLKNHGISGSIPTQVGASYAIPRGALIEKFGRAAVDAQDEQVVREGSTNPQALAMLAAQLHGGQAGAYLPQAQSMAYSGIRTDYQNALTPPPTQQQNNPLAQS